MPRREKSMGARRADEPRAGASWLRALRHRQAASEEDEEAVVVGVVVAAAGCCWLDESMRRSRPGLTAGVRRLDVAAVLHVAETCFHVGLCI